MSVSLGDVEFLTIPAIASVNQSAIILNQRKQKKSSPTKPISDPHLESLATDSNNNHFDDEEDGEIRTVEREEEMKGKGGTFFESPMRRNKETRDATDDSLESGPLDYTFPEDGNDDAGDDGFSDGQVSIAEAGFLDGRNLRDVRFPGSRPLDVRTSSKRLARSSSSPAAFASSFVGDGSRPDSADADSPRSRKSSPRHFAMSGEVRDLRPSK